MYQPCTSTTVNLGEQRGVTVTRKRVVISPNAALPGSAETLGPGLITRRSQVQILPPPPRNSRSEALSVRRRGLFVCRLSTFCQHHDGVGGVQLRFMLDSVTPVGG